jgi:hypothetical protein
MFVANPVKTRAIYTENVSIEVIIAIKTFLGYVISWASNLNEIFRMAI